MKQRVFITGASSGIGKSMATQLQKEGYQVIGTSRNPQRYADKLPYELVQLDVIDRISLEKCVATLQSKNFIPDVVINNAGNTLLGAIEESSIQQAKALFDLNFWGMAALNRLVLPLMRANGGGKILHITSLAGLIGVPFQGYYSATKHAIEGYVKSLKYEVEPFNIEVGALELAFTKTNIHNVMQKGDQPMLAYDSIREHNEAVLQKTFAKGVSPDKITKLVSKIIKKRKLKVSYKVGTDTFLLPIINYLMPRFFYKVSTNVFELNKVDRTLKTVSSVA